MARRQDGSASPRVWLQLIDVSVDGLRVGEFIVRDGETWGVFGDNHSGVDRFVALIGGEIEPEEATSFSRPDRVGVVSFTGQQALFEDEVARDESDFLDRPDPGTPARSFLGSHGPVRELIGQFGLDRVIDRGYRQLSSGESRKLMILRAVTHGARHLLVENPYDGLDVSSCADFDRMMTVLAGQGVGVIAVVSSRFDIPGWCSHLAWIDRGAVAAAGPRATVLRRLGEARATGHWRSILADGGTRRLDRMETLVRLVDGHAGYGRRTVLSGVDLTVKSGQHTLITGPNGAGKSTLLGLVSGDHQDCYANELYLFGRRRGSGESIWDVKREMGIVSPALHREHYVPGTCLQIVVSGFYDSIGLYRRPTRRQRELARAWLAVIGLAGQERTPFRRLGFARQRLALIARALIKLPRLLLLDEPTHGLDDANRASLLDFLELVADREISTILYVSHRRDEFRPFFRQRIELDSGPAQ